MMVRDQKRHKLWRAAVAVMMACSFFFESTIWASPESGTLSPQSIFNPAASGELQDIGFLEAALKYNLIKHEWLLSTRRDRAIRIENNPLFWTIEFKFSMRAVLKDGSSIIPSLINRQRAYYLHLKEISGDAERFRVASCRREDYEMARRAPLMSIDERLRAGEAGELRKTASGMGLGMRLDPEPALEQELTLEQRQELELWQLMEGAHDVPNATRGLKGLIAADRMLRAQGAVGIVIGSAAATLWDPACDAEMLREHSDIDVLVLTEGFTVKKPFAGGIDWWLPVKVDDDKKKLIEPNGHIQRFFVNGNNIALMAEPGCLFARFPDFYVGLNLPNKAYLRELSLSALMARTGIGLEKAEELLEKIYGEAGDEYEEERPQYWKNSFLKKRPGGFVLGKGFLYVRYFNTDTLMAIEAHTPHRDVEGRGEIAALVGAMQKPEGGGERTEEGQGAEGEEDDRATRSGADDAVANKHSTDAQSPSLLPAEKRSSGNNITITGDGGRFKYLNPALLPNGVLLARRVPKEVNTARPHRSDIARLLPVDGTNGTAFTSDGVLIPDAEDPRIMRFPDGRIGMTFIRCFDDGTNWHSWFCFVDGLGNPLSEPVPIGRPGMRSKNTFFVPIEDGPLRGKIALIDRANETSESSDYVPAIQLYLFNNIEEALAPPPGYWERPENSVLRRTIMRAPDEYTHIGFSTVLGIVGEGDERALLAYVHCAVVPSGDGSHKCYDTAAVLLDPSTLMPLGKPAIIHKGTEDDADGDVKGVIYETAVSINGKEIISYAGKNDSDIVWFRESVDDVVTAFWAVNGAGARRAASPGDGTRRVTAAGTPPSGPEAEERIKDDDPRILELVRTGKTSVTADDGKVFTFTLKPYAEVAYQGYEGWFADAKRAARIEVHDGTTWVGTLDCVDNLIDYGFVDCDLTHMLYRDYEFRQRTTALNVTNVYAAHRQKIMDMVTGDYKGIGRTLMAFGMGVAKHDGWAVFNIAAVDREAVTFYQRLGFAMAAFDTEGSYDLRAKPLPKIEIVRAENGEAEESCWSFMPERPWGDDETRTTSSGTSTAEAVRAPSAQARAIKSGQDIIHEENGGLTPAIPYGKVLWHVAVNELIPDEQQKMGLITKVNQLSSRSEAPEKIRILNRHEDVSDVIADLLRDPANIVHVIVNEPDRVRGIPPGVKIAVVSGELGNYTQLEGIIAISRALDIEDRSLRNAKLSHLYKVLTGEEFTGVFPDTDDPKALALAIVFFLPKIVIEDYEDLLELNRNLIRLLENV